MANRKLAYLLSISILALTLLGQVVALPRSAASSQVNPSAAPSATGTAYPLHVTLTGTGATFPAPIIRFWAANYTADHQNVTIAYNAVGSGKGQLAAADKVGDFFASDAPLSTSQRPLYPNILHIPETIGSIVPAYNLPGVTQQLQFNGTILGEIYVGKIQFWDDPQIAAINPGVTLPHHNITTVHRFDGSGTSFVWESYLLSHSKDWSNTCGPTATTAWPTKNNCAGGAPTACNPLPCALTGTGNPGVANTILTNQYSLGYVELNYALCPSPPNCVPMTFGTVLNGDGSAFVAASTQTTFWAVANYTKNNILPAGNGDWSGVSMLNQPGGNTYPIASFTYLLVYQELNVLPSMNLNETGQKNALLNFLNWVVTTGQKYSELPQLSYVSLPPSVVAIDQASINSITYTPISQPVHITYNISVSNTAGWSLSTITANSGDTITLMLTSGDGLAHQWYVDFDNNGLLDPNENNTNVCAPPVSFYCRASTVFSSATATNFTFIPLIFNSNSIPSYGSWTFRDSRNAASSGTFQILPQQIAIPFVPPANNLLDSHIPVMDTSRITTQGSLVVDMRTLTYGGSITEVTVDSTSTSGTPTSNKIFQLSSLHFKSVPAGLQSQFILVAATAPNATSSDVTVTLSGVTGTATYIVTRNLDFVHAGAVTIADLATVAFHFHTSLGQANFLPVADVNADNSIGIDDLSIQALFFKAPAFS